VVAAVVSRAKTYLGEAAAALPAGSVLLGPAKAAADGERFIFDTTAAIAVATAAAVFETAGQSISERRDEILVVAQAAHRDVHRGIGAEGELSAALHGGLAKVVSQADAAPRVEAVRPPAGLHLVVFQAGHALFPEGWLASVRQFSERDRIGYARIANELFEQASRFATGLSQGNATAAIAAAGRYGNCITQLAAAVSAPLQSGLFMRAMELAREIGGIAKTTNAGRGGLGVAMFATPEAASLFAHACQPSALPLAVELDRAGVRCLVPAAVQTPAPETGPSSISAEAIVRDSIDERTTEKTLPEAEPASEKVDLPDESPEHPPRKGRRFGPAIGGLLLIAGLLAGWLTNALGVHSAPQVKTPDRAAALKNFALPAPEVAAPIAPAGVEIAPVPSGPAVQVVAPSSKPQPMSAKQHALAHRGHGPKPGKGRRPEATAATTFCWYSAEASSPGEFPSGATSTAIAAMVTLFSGCRGAAELRTGRPAAVHSAASAAAAMAD